MSHKLSFIPDDEPNEIVRRYEKFLSRQKDVSGYFDVEELESIIDYYLQGGRTNESSAALEFGFTLHPNSSALKMKRAKNLLAVGDCMKAYRILDQLTEKEDYEAMLLRIEALARMDRLTEALALCNTLCSNEKSSLDTTCFDIALVFLSLPSHNEAKTFLTKGLQANPNNIEILFELAFCNEQLFDIDEALVNYQKITDIDPFNSEAWFNLGQLYMGRHEMTNAIHCYSYVQAINPNDTLSYLQKAHCFFNQSLYRESLAEYKEYTKLTSETWQTHLFVGECYERLELYNDAIVWYHKSLEIKKDNYEALTGIAICLLEKELYHECFSFLRSAIELKPEAPDVWVYFGEALTGINETEAALWAYQKAIELDPDQPETLMAMGNIHFEKGNFQMALDYYTLAEQHDIDSGLENIHIFLAICYQRLGDNERTDFHLHFALQVNPEAMALYYELTHNDEANTNATNDTHASI